MIVTCSCSSYNAAETVSTLRFGVRAKSIQNQVQRTLLAPPATTTEACVFLSMF
jgi:kinesin family protein 5